MPCRIGRKYHFLALVLDPLILLARQLQNCCGAFRTLLFYENRICILGRNSDGNPRQIHGGGHS